MKTKNDQDQYYERFKKNLFKSQKWPGTYLFKFIVISKAIKPQFFKQYFANNDSKIFIKNSSNKKFKSITIKSKINSPEEVIHIYKEISKIDKIIIL